MNASPEAGVEPRELARHYKRLGLSQTAFAGMIGLRKSTLCKTEKGSRDLKPEEQAKCVAELRLLAEQRKAAAEEALAYTQQFSALAA